MEFKRIVSCVLMFSMLFGLVAATSGIKSGICGLYSLIASVLTAVVFLLIVAAAIVYAGGQLLGAETRARATVWATSMFIGALIGILIYVIVPMVLGMMMPGGLGTSC